MITKYLELLSEDELEQLNEILSDYPMFHRNIEIDFEDFYTVDTYFKGNSSELLSNLTSPRLLDSDDWLFEETKKYLHYCISASEYSFYENLQELLEEVVLNDLDITGEDPVYDIIDWDAAYTKYIKHDDSNYFIDESRELYVNYLS